MANLPSTHSSARLPTRVVARCNRALVLVRLGLAGVAAGGCEARTMVAFSASGDAAAGGSTSSIATGGTSNQALGGSETGGKSEATTPATGGTSADCGLFGAACTSDYECCQGMCGFGAPRVCIPFPSCQAQGKPCMYDWDCCDSKCDQTTGTCQSYSGCRASRELCSSNNECCSGVCIDTSGVGNRVCATLDGCSPVGDICFGNGDCCSGPNSCAFDREHAVNILRCTPQTSDCVQLGELCSPTEPCCSLNRGAPDSGSSFIACMANRYGVHRCALTHPQPVGTPCASHLDCQSQYCLPTSGGSPGYGFQCAAGCAKSRDRCRSPQDCCSGLTCENGSCRSSGSTCLQLGAKCDQANADECCSGYCDSSGAQVCAVNPD